MRKVSIPKALRDQVWISWIGKKFNNKCSVTWCQNIISVFDFECGHNVPESKGGATDINNLRPICAKCNRSMGDEYTIDQFSALSSARDHRHLWECFRLKENDV
jgi:5-methylcytosine-specific restriction endonuclease McrA